MRSHYPLHDSTAAIITLMSPLHTWCYGWHVKLKLTLLDTTGANDSTPYIAAVAAMIKTLENCIFLLLSLNGQNLEFLKVVFPIRFFIASFSKVYLYF